MSISLTPAETARWQNPATIARLLRTARVIAIYGCSADPMKDSHEVAAYLQQAGYRIIPISPRGGTVLGEPVRASLAEIDAPVDIVDCFRPSAKLPDIVAKAIAAQARAVWLQLGLFDRAAAEAAEAAGLAVVVDRCTKIEHSRLR
jgi:predicted CoA-binding protein